MPIILSHETFQRRSRPSCPAASISAPLSAVREVIQGDSNGQVLQQRLQAEGQIREEQDMSNAQEIEKLKAEKAKLVELCWGMIDCSPGADTIPDDLHEARKAAMKFLKEIGEL